jgi:hypothetical protein
MRTKQQCSCKTVNHSVVVNKGGMLCKKREGSEGDKIIGAHIALMGHLDVDGRSTHHHHHHHHRRRHSNPHLHPHPHPHPHDNDDGVHRPNHEHAHVQVLARGEQHRALLQ